MNGESSTLTLRSVNSSNITNYSWTWSDIDLRRALGTIYDKYDVL